MSTSLPLISIIVPVYNIKNYVKECVESIISQSYANLEIILVDDGSFDGSENICEGYKNLDNRIAVIHKKNGGLSDARNVAIDICKGEYITFIDGDDIVSPNYVEVLFNALINSSSKISICSHVDFNDSRSINYKKSDHIEVYSCDDAIKEILINGKFTTSAWGKLYSRDLFENIRYPIGKIYEDLPTTWKLFLQTKEIVYTPSQEYYYRQNPTSIMNSKFSLKNLDIIDAHESVINGLADYRPQLLKYAYGRLGIYSSIQLFKALASGYHKIDDLKTLKFNVTKNLMNITRSNYHIKIKIFSYIISFPYMLNLFVGINKIRKG